MRKLFALLTVAGVYAAPTSHADAQGVHFGGAGVHVDVGRPHGGYAYRHHHPSVAYVQRPSYAGWGAHQGYAEYHNPGHYDVHPGGYQRHFNHLDYSPAHYDYHSQGHFGYHH